MNAPYWDNEKKIWKNVPKLPEMTEEEKKKAIKHQEFVDAWHRMIYA